jgi:hypothetical protein
MRVEHEIIGSSPPSPLRGGIEGGGAGATAGTFYKKLKTNISVVTLPLAGRVREGGGWPEYRGSCTPSQPPPSRGRCSPVPPVGSIYEQPKDY